MENITRVRGTSFEMGYTQGAENSTLVKYWHDHVFSRIEPRFLRYFKLPVHLLAPFLGYIAGGYLKSSMRTFLPGETERLYGLAKGAGCGAGKLFMLQWIEIMGAFPMYWSNCSSLAIGVSRSASSELLLGKNFDFLPFLKNMQILRVSQPSDGYHSLEQTLAPTIGSHAGMNEKGLTILYNYAFARGRPKRGLPLSMIVQHILKTCKNLRDAEIKLNNLPRASGGILVIGDSNGKFGVVELSPNSLCWRQVDGDIAIVTNHYLDEGMKPFEIPPGAKYHPILLPSPWKGVKIHETSLMRHKALERYFKVHEKTTVENIQELLADHGGTNTGSNNTVCRHSNIASTLSSIIFLPTSKQIMYCYGFPCTGTYNHFEIENLL